LEFSELFLSFWSFQDYFSHYSVFRVLLVILEFSGLFWSLWCFRDYFGHFGVFGVIFIILVVPVCILVILGVLSVFWGLFWLFLNF
jgi:hypothetical protein